jgi:hypothetical protein
MSNNPTLREHAIHARKGLWKDMGHTEGGAYCKICRQDYHQFVYTYINPTPCRSRPFFIEKKLAPAKQM